MTLSSLRQSKGLSQRELAERSGLAQAMVSRVESEGYNPTLDSLRAYAKGLDVPVSVVASILSGEKTDTEKLSITLTQ